MAARVAIESPRMKYILAAALFVASSLPAQGQTCTIPIAPGVSSQQLTSGQRARVYRLFVPPGYDGRARLPLVLDLHGSGGTAARQAATSGFETLAAREGVLVATLQAQAEGNRWNVPITEGRPDDVACRRRGSPARSLPCRSRSRR